MFFLLKKYIFFNHLLNYKSIMPSVLDKFVASWQAYSLYRNYKTDLTFLKLRDWNIDFNNSDQIEEYCKCMYSLLNKYPCLFIRCKRSNTGLIVPDSEQYNFIADFLNYLEKNPDKRIIPNIDDACIALFWLSDEGKEDIYKILYGDVVYKFPTEEITMDNLHIIINIFDIYRVNIMRLLHKPTKKISIEVFDNEDFEYMHVNMWFWRLFNVEDLVPHTITKENEKCVRRIIKYITPEEALKLYTPEEIAMYSTF